MKTIAEIVKQCIAKEACRPKEEISLAHTFGALDLDSLDFYEVVMGIEDELRLDIDDSKLPNGHDTTVQSFINAVEQYIDSVPGLRGKLDRQLGAAA